MIVTLIPFLLAARIESPNLPSLENGTEVTYLVENKATTRHAPDSNHSNMNFHLRTMMTCQSSDTVLHCRFHDVLVNSTPKDVNQPKPQNYIEEDLWTMKILQQAKIMIALGKNGTGEVWITIKVDAIGRRMMYTLGKLLIVGVDLSTRQNGDFENPSNFKDGSCRIRYSVTQSSPYVKDNSSDMNLFLISRPNESLVSPLVIAQVMEDPKCITTLYSFWASRELQELDPSHKEVKVNLAEKHIIMTNHNFTVSSTIKTTIKNYKDNTKYIIDESMSLSLQGINSGECDM